MTTLLAIDTATDALSLAYHDGESCRAVHRVMPRQHHQQVFAVLNELLEGAAPASLGVDAIVFGRGPGSFTGLRIAVSAAQGLGFSLQVPLIGISSLETQARTLLRQCSISSPCILLSTIDARIGQVYAQAFHFDGERLQALDDACVAPPAELSPDFQDSAVDDIPVLGVGTGYRLRDAMTDAWRTTRDCWPEVLPEAQDMLSPALSKFARGEVVAAQEASPDYVQQRIGWKTLAEQAQSR